MEDSTWQTTLPPVERLDDSAAGQADALADHCPTGPATGAPGIDRHADRFASPLNRGGER